MWRKKKTDAVEKNEELCLYETGLWKVGRLNRTSCQIWINCTEGRSSGREKCIISLRDNYSSYPLAYYKAGEPSCMMVIWSCDLPPQLDELFILIYRYIPFSTVTFFEHKNFLKMSCRIESLSWFNLASIYLAGVLCPFLHCSLVSSFLNHLSLLFSKETHIFISHKD